MTHQRRKIEGVLFDVYNTLIRRKQSDLQCILERADQGTVSPSEKVEEEAHRAVMDFYRSDRHRAWAVKDINSFWQKFYTIYIDALGISDPGEKIARDITEWTRQASSYDITEGTLEVLETLGQRGYKTGLLSNWDVSLAEFCADLGLADSVDMIIASDEIGVRKPATEIFVEAAHRLDIPQEHCLYIGDSLVKDVKGGKSAGMATVWFNPMCTRRSIAVEDRPDTVISDLTEILDFLPE